MQRRQDTMDRLPAGMFWKTRQQDPIEKFWSSSSVAGLDYATAAGYNGQAACWYVLTDLTAGSNRKVLEQFQCCRPCLCNGSGIQWTDCLLVHFDRLDSRIQ